MVNWKTYYFRYENTNCSLCNYNYNMTESVGSGTAQISIAKRKSSTVGFALNDLISTSDQWPNGISYVTLVVSSVSSALLELTSVKIHRTAGYSILETKSISDLGITIGVGTYVFEIETINWSSGSSGDEMVIEFDITNNDTANAQTFDISINGSKIEYYHYPSQELTKISDPPSLPTGSVMSVAFSPDGSLLAVGIFQSPYIKIYRTTDWTSFSPPNLPTGTVYGLDFSPNGSILACATEGSNNLILYNTNDWSKITNPSTWPPYIGYSVAFSPDGSLLAVGFGSGGPYIYIYDTSDWSILTGMPTWTGVYGYGVSFSPDGKYFAYGHTAGNDLSIYTVSNWTKISDPSSLPLGTVKSTMFSPDSSILACATSGSTPFLINYNTNDWSKITDPETPPPDYSTGVDFSPDGSLVAYAHNTTPFFSVYTVDGMEKLNNPTTLPTGSSFCIDFSPDGKYLVVGHTTSPYISIYSLNIKAGRKMNNMSKNIHNYGGMIV